MFYYYETESRSVINRIVNLSITIAYEAIYYNVKNTEQHSNTDDTRNKKNIFPQMIEHVYCNLLTSLCYLCCYFVVDPNHPPRDTGRPKKLRFQKSRSNVNRGLSQNEGTFTR